MIAIIAILSVVVILTLNPAELLRQSRDSNRLSDLATVTSALGLYSEDIGGNMGSASTTYISIPDQAATSTQGDQCQGLGLLSLASGTGESYKCVSQNSVRSVNGTGWIPVNFSSISSGAPLGSLPVDPANQSSSDLFYTYATDGTKYEVTTIFESQKYKSLYSSSPSITGYPGVFAKGSSLSLSHIFDPNDLVGYWPLDEGVGTSVLDRSGSGNNGTWSGTTAGNSGTYYVGGKVGNYAGQFNGGNDQILISQTNTQAMNFGTGSFSVSLWINSPNFTSNGAAIRPFEFAVGTNGSYFAINIGKTGASPSYADLDIADDSSGDDYVQSTATIPTNTWTLVTSVVDRQAKTIQIYLNGILSASSSLTETGNIDPAGGLWTIGGWNGLALKGSLDDVRVYDRALSPAEVQAIYNVEK